MDTRTFTLLKVGLALAALGFLVYYVEPSEIVAAAASAHRGWLLAALALLSVNLGLQLAIWHRLVRRIAPDVTRRQALGALLCGFALGLFTPARAGEFAGRAFYLDHPDKWALGAVVFAQGLLAFAAAMDGGLAAYAYALSTGLIPATPLWWAVGAGGTVLATVLTFLLLFPAVTYRLLLRLPRADAVAPRIAFLRELPRAEAARLLALSLVHYGTYVTQFVLLVLAFDAPFAVGAAYLGVGLVFFIKFMLPPVTFSDVGIREGVAVFVLGGMGMAGAAAFNAAFLLYAINLLVPAALGVPFILRLRGRSRAKAP